MGGRITYALLTKYPDRVASAVTVGASPGIGTLDARRERAERDRERSVRLETEGLPAFLESWYALPLFDTLRAQPGYAELLARRREGHASALASALRAMSPGVMPDLASDLAATDTSIAAVAGALDDTYIDVVDRLAASNPRIRAHRVENAGHAAHVERPDAVAEVVADAIVEQEGSE
jgi:2-succinyl-6-hydroxy-2,4-cyclohexadiene-1-carboxylate synthase